MVHVQFGEIDIDSELVTARDTLGDGEQQIMMLNNGCLCCTVRDDLVKMLAELVSLLFTGCSARAAFAVPSGATSLRYLLSWRAEKTQ